MKKIYSYLIAAVAVTSVFTACHPLDKVNEQVGPAPSPAPSTATVTLSTTDYAILPTSNYAKTAAKFKTKEDAAAGIPTILASKYAKLPEKSTIAVTYNLNVPQITLADSLQANQAYTVTTADYTDPAGQAITKTTFKDYSDAQVLLFLTWKFPNPQPNQMVYLTYNWFQSSVTPSAGVVTTDSFIYLNGTWVKAYTISAQQYTDAGRGNFKEFVAADQANLPSIFNTFLKTDPTVPAPKFGDLKYVSYCYFASSKVYQRVLVMEWNGTDWVASTVPATLSFAKTNGTWVADNSIYYTLVGADYTYIADNVQTGASTAAVANLKQFGDFNIQGSTTNWTDAQINTGLIGFLAYKYGSTAAANQKFTLTYLAYNGANTNFTKTFQYNGTTFVLVQ